MTRAFVGAMLLAAALLGGCASPPTAAPAAPGGAEFIVAFDDRAPGPGAAGGSAGGYRGAAAYVGSAAAGADAAAVLREFGLQALEAWTIAPLGLRCLRVAAPPGTRAESLLQQLQGDRRVALAQPLNDFSTYSAPAEGPAYDDPYLKLQHGFAGMRAAAAQQHSRGEGVRLALIDTAVDTTHPDLAGRIAAARDLVSHDAPAAPQGERHGTELAGVIGAAANNRIGIVGVAPQARLTAYRACWSLPGRRSAACNSFTLARALVAALADGSDVMNLSLGGPPDPLLQRLVEMALQRGVIVVAALPPEGGLTGFPAGVPGVLVAAVAEQGAAPASALRAPGREVLTLVPGGAFDYASGSSLAAAHVSAAAALLRALEPGLRPERAQALLRGDAAHGAGLDLCAALQRLRPGLRCAP